MRRSREDTVAGHALIVQLGSKMIRERGIEGTSVADVMAEAGRTHGGFYRHFATKTDLVAACLDRAFDEVLEVIGAPPSQAGAVGFEAFARFYLSDDHVANPGLGCPAAALGSEIRRAPPAVQAAFKQGMVRMVEAIVRVRGGTDGDRQAQAAWRLGLLIGAASSARAVDPVLSRAIRDAALTQVLAADAR